MTTMDKNSHKLVAENLEQAQYLGYYFAPLPNYIYTPSKTFVPCYTCYLSTLYYVSYEPGFNFEPSSPWNYQMSRQGAVSPLGALSGVSTLSIASGSSVDSPSSKAFKKQGHTQQRKKDRQVARKAMLAEVPEEEADGMGEKDLEEGLKGGVDGGENEDVSKDIVDVFPPEKGVKLGSCCTLEGGCEEVVVKGKGEVRDAKVDLTQLANARCHQE